MRLFEIQKLCPEAIILPSDYDVLGLACIVMVAREEIARAERFARARMEKRVAAPPFLH